MSLLSRSGSRLSLRALSVPLEMIVSIAAQVAEWRAAMTASVVRGFSQKLSGERTLNLSVCGVVGALVAKVWTSISV